MDHLLSKESDRASHFAYELRIARKYKITNKRFVKLVIS